MKLVRTAIGNYYCPDDPGEVGYVRRPQRRSVTDEEAAILADLATGKVVLEIGTGLAVATRALASTATRVVTVDIDPWVQNPELPNVEFRRDFPEGEEFDLVFIDGNHERPSVVADVERCRHIPLLVLHDTYLPSVARAICQCGLHLRKAYDTKCRLATYTHS